MEEKGGLDRRWWVVSLFTIEMKKVGEVAAKLPEMDYGFRNSSRKNKSDQLRVPPACGDERVGGVTTNHAARPLTPPEKH